MSCRYLRILSQRHLWILLGLAINVVILSSFQERSNACDTLNTNRYIGKVDKIKDLANNYCNRELLNQLISYYHKNQKTNEQLRCANILLDYSKSEQDSVNLASAYFSKANVFRKKFIIDSSFYYYDKSQKLFSLLNNTKFRIKSLRRKAYLYSLISDYNRSLELNFKALELSGQIDDFDLIYQSNFSIVVTYGYLKEPDIAKKYHDEALAIIDAHKEELKEFYQIYRSQLHNHQGSAYLKSDRYREAKAYYLKARNVSNIKTIYPELYAAIIGNLAYAKFKLGERNGIEAQLKRSLQLKDSLDNQALTAVTKRHLAEYFHENGEQQKSLSYIRSSLRTAKEYNLTDEVLDALRLLAVIDESSDQEHLSRYIRINDSIVNREREQRDKFARIEYETQQLEQANALNAARNDRLELQLFIVALVTLFSLITLTLIYVNRRRKTINKNLKLREENEAARAEVFKLILDQQKKIKLAKIKEQERIAYELHDTIVSQLSAIRFKLFGEISRHFKKLSPNFEKNLSELSQLEADLRSISHDVKNQSSYIPDNFPLALKELLQSLEASYQIKTELHLNTSELYQVRDEHKIEIFKTIQEGIQNIRKYARADKVDLYIKDTDSKVVFELHDNGVGFNTVEAKKGLGLKSMERRISSIKAQLHIDSQIDEGTALRIFYPI